MKSFDIIAHLLLLVVLVEAKGGRGGGGRSGGTASASGMKSDDEGGETETTEKSHSEAAKVTISAFLGVCIAIFGVSYLLFAFRKFCRPRKDLRTFIGISLARIHNVDAETPE